MAKNTKTPAMVLTELSIKRGHAAPKFDLIYSNLQGHDNEFTYQVEVEGVMGTGTGKSKKEAKHLAAYNALEGLKAVGICYPDTSSTDPDKMTELPSPKRNAVNCMSTLADLCAEYKLPEPDYIPLSEVGPPHCREFSYECHVGEIRTRATSGTKKQARQIAAQDMLMKVRGIICDSNEDTSSCLSKVNDENPDIICNFMRLSNFMVKPNLAMPILDYCDTIPNLMEEKEVEYEEIYKFFKLSNNESTLKDLLSTLELKYAIEVIQADPYIICLNVNTDTPFTTISMAERPEEAINNVVKDAFDYLKLYTNYSNSSSGITPMDTL